MLKTLLESVVVLIPTVLPLLTVPLIPLAAAPLAGFAGLAGLGRAGCDSADAGPPATDAPRHGGTTGPHARAHAGSRTGRHPGAGGDLGTGAHATTAAADTGRPSAGHHAGLPVHGRVLSASARRAASQAAKAKEAQPAEGTENPAAATAPKKTPGGRRRRAGVERLGRGHEYIDLDDEPTVYPSTQGAGPLGFSGTATKVSAGAATGLATLAEDDFGSAPRMPMMPSTWGNDSPELTDED